MPALIIKASDTISTDTRKNELLPKKWDVIQVFRNGFDHKQHNGYKLPVYYVLYVNGRSYENLLPYKIEDRSAVITDDVGRPALVRRRRFQIEPLNIPISTLSELETKGFATASWADISGSFRNKSTGLFE